jgi:glycosyltransferase involved in cell wall biosynthesis
VSNVIERLSARHEFFVVTRDRDLGDDQPYPDLPTDTWLDVGPGKVRYLAPNEITPSKLQSIILEVSPDVLYHNSFFSPKLSILPAMLRRLRRIPPVPVVIAPRGEFSAGALGLKRGKKALYLRAARLARIYGGVTWQASSERDAMDIRQTFGPAAQVVVAPDIPVSTGPYPEIPESKQPGKLSVVFLSRISPMKNLTFAIEALRGVEGEVALDVYGPQEDATYWNECLRLARDLPENAKMSYRGLVPQAKVLDVLSRYDLFFLPTRGENLGHAILEAMLAGCPVLISDRTPWRELEQVGAGWDLPLDSLEAYGSALRTCVEMEAGERKLKGEAARRFALEWCARAEREGGAERLFEAALEAANKKRI